MNGIVGNRGHMLCRPCNGKREIGGLFASRNVVTGLYPTWWKGATFEKPPVLWAGSVTSEATRDNPQRIPVGLPPKEDEWGTGLIRGDRLVDRSHGTANVLDNVLVKHGGGGDVQAGVAVCAFKS